MSINMTDDNPLILLGLKLFKFMYNMFMEQIKPQCLKCIHYFATYDSQSPRGCKAYGFRSAMIPSLVIKRETGSECAQYKLRASKNDNSKKDQAKNLNDPKYW
jgi:hypothetical protein